MNFYHDNVRRVFEEEDRLSKLPDELLHKIMSCLDIKSAVQTCSLSTRWKLLWTSMTNLNFSVLDFPSPQKFSDFVKDVLYRRNHQVELSSVKLHLDGRDSHGLLKTIADYAFSHNVQQVNVVSCRENKQEGLASFLQLTSHSLKHFTFSSYYYYSLSITPETTLNFPALQTLHLSDIKLCDDVNTNTRKSKSIDLFSKCVNLKDLTLKYFTVKAVGVFDIITPRLSNLTLVDGVCSLPIKVIAPELENLTITDCSIKNLIAPSGLPSLCYTGGHISPKWFNDQFNSLKKVSLCMFNPNGVYNEEDARETIKMLQKLGNAKYLTLNADTIECLSSFPDVVSHHPSPFSNLISLTIDSSKKKDVAYKVKMCTEARSFFLENSPNATFSMESPKGC